MEDSVYRWSVVDETTKLTVASGCQGPSGPNEPSNDPSFHGEPGQRVALTTYSEDVQKTSKHAIPIESAYWCSTTDDSSRKRVRASTQIDCAHTDPNPPATLDSVDLINPESDGITTSEDTIFHMTVQHPGAMWLVFDYGSCTAPGRILLVTIL